MKLEAPRAGQEFALLQASFVSHRKLGLSTLEAKRAAGRISLAATEVLPALSTESVTENTDPVKSHLPSSTAFRVIFLCE